MDITFDLKNIKEMVTKKNFYFRTFTLIFSVALLALNYNLFLTPNQFVTGGTSGLAIIIQSWTGLDTALFIGIASFVLIVLSLLFLGWKETKISIVGSIMYPFFISITEPIAKYCLSYLQFDSIIIVVLIAGMLNGLANGIIYKTGFNTGGSDILMKIVNKYAKIPEGKAVFSVNLLIMLLGCFVFGLNKFVYSLLILFLSTIIIDRILIGVSSSKLFFIYTKEEEKIKTFVWKN